MNTNKDFCPNNYRHEFTVTRFETIRCVHCNQTRPIESPAKTEMQCFWDSRKEHVVTDKEVINLAENEIKSLREQLNDMTVRYQALKDAYDKLVEQRLRKVKI